MRDVFKILKCNMPSGKKKKFKIEMGNVMNYYNYN